jgi:hypothetical protein
MSLLHWKKFKSTYTNTDHQNEKKVLFLAEAGSSLYATMFTSALGVWSSFLGGKAAEA